MPRCTLLLVLGGGKQERVSCAHISALVLVWRPLCCRASVRPDLMQGKAGSLDPAPATICQKYSRSRSPAGGGHLTPTPCRCSPHSAMCSALRPCNLCEQSVGGVLWLCLTICLGPLLPLPLPLPLSCQAAAPPSWPSQVWWPPSLCPLCSMCSRKTAVRVPCAPEKLQSVCHVLS